MTPGEANHQAAHRTQPASSLGPPRLVLVAL